MMRRPIPIKVKSKDLSQISELLREGIQQVRPPRRHRVRIPTKPIADSEAMAIAIPRDTDRRRSEAALSCSYHAEAIGIRQSFCG